MSSSEQPNIGRRAALIMIVGGLASAALLPGALRSKEGNYVSPILTYFDQAVFENEITLDAVTIAFSPHEESTHSKTVAYENSATGTYLGVTTFPGEEHIYRVAFQTDRLPPEYGNALSQNMINASPRVQEEQFARLEIIVETNPEEEQKHTILSLYERLGNPGDKVFGTREISRGMLFWHNTRNAYTQQPADRQILFGKENHPSTAHTQTLGLYLDHIRESSLL